MVQNHIETLLRGEMAVLRAADMDLDDVFIGQLCWKVSFANGHDTPAETY